jgi:hypothetical protein
MMLIQHTDEFGRSKREVPTAVQQLFTWLLNNKASNNDNNNNNEEGRMTWLLIVIYVIRQWLITTTRKTHSVILTVHIAPKPEVYQENKNKGE